MDDHDPPRGPRPGLPGPLLLLVPLTVLAATLAWLPSRRPAGGRYPEAPPAGEAREVDAWSGSGAAGEGRLVAALTRLHADPARQAFDAGALARRLALPPGEPWRLELRYEAPPGAEPWAVPASLGVRGEGGGALGAPARPSTAGGAVDPVAVLVSPPAALAPGRRTELVLWGEEPRGEARLEAPGLQLRLGRSFRELRTGASLLAEAGEQSEPEVAR
jgi:hypothetical protein